MESCAFAPAHLTGLFKIYNSSSAGAGMALQHGMHTRVAKSESSKSTVSINAMPSSAPVSRWVLSKFQKLLGCNVSISHSTPIPIGCGLGMSAAGALSLSLALNDFALSPLSRAQCVKIAHNADVACGTGLASVDAQAIGALASRKGGSGRPDVRKFSPGELSTQVRLFVFGPMRTSSIIRSSGWKEKINAAGTECLGIFYSKPSLDSLCLASNAFALRTGLGKWAQDALSQHPKTGMAMLGKTLFDVGGGKQNAPLIKNLPLPKIIATYPTNLKAHLCH